MLSGMPNLAHPLFSTPVAAIDTEVVRDFLALKLEESFTVDYKRGFEAAAETVAAMANSYGGVILIGVDADPRDKNLPGDLVGVKAIDKDRLVSKMATTFDPPGWTPDVIPVSVDDKLLLVVRIDPDSVPRPLFHQGAVRIRLDGRNATADRRLVQLLFQQAATTPAFAYTSDPRFAPDQHGAPHFRSAYQAMPPDLIVRAAACRPLRQDLGRLRLHGSTIDALMRSLSAPSVTDLHALPERLHAFARRVDSQQFQEPWTIDTEHGHALFVRLAAGHAPPEKPARPGSEARVRLECTVSLTSSGTSLEVLSDLLLWTNGQKVNDDLWIQACYEAVRALVYDALPTLSLELLGTGALPTPPIELHICPGAKDVSSLQDILNPDLLGQRTGTGDMRRGSDFLPEELVAAGDLGSAVTAALRNIALDWRYLHPQFPPLHD